MVTLALLTAGERPDSPTIKKALDYLRGFGPNDLHSTYAIALQTMVFAAADPAKDEAADQAPTSNGSKKPRSSPATRRSGRVRGATPSRSGAGPAIIPTPSTPCWGCMPPARSASPSSRPSGSSRAATGRRSQKRDGSWAYTPDSNNPTASMTCAGISSLIISGLRRFQGGEFLQGESIQECGSGGVNRSLQPRHRLARQPFSGRTELRRRPPVAVLLPLRSRASRPARRHPVLRSARLVPPGRRRAGARPGSSSTAPGAGSSSRTTPCWRPASRCSFWPRAARRCSSTSCATAPPATGTTTPTIFETSSTSSRATGRHLLTWQVVDPGIASVPELLQAPIIFFNGHKAPEFSALARQNLREYVEQGGFIFAEACCGSREFDAGFKRLMKEIFPGRGLQASSAFGGPSGLARQEPAQSRSCPALGHRARLPHRRHLFAG